MQKKKKLYMILTKDKYELPRFVADSVPELSRMSGKTVSAIRSGISRGCKGYAAVEIEEDEDDTD